jgi:hypothetical protein
MDAAGDLPLFYTFHLTTRGRLNPSRQVFSSNTNTVSRVQAAGVIAVLNGKQE